MGYREYVKANKKFTELDVYQNSVYVIHYSCSSFYEGGTPHITSIAVKDINSMQVHSFSIYQIAEVMGVNSSEITSNYSKLEKKLLNDFYDFMKNNQNAKWIHWNMRNIEFGFQAIEQRAVILGVSIQSISDSDKYNLAELLKMKYGNNYIPHGECGRLHSLMLRNNLTDVGFLSGKQEAEYAKEENYIKVHQSTLRKVEVMSQVYQSVLSNSLKTDAKYTEMYGRSLLGVYSYLQSKWWGQVLLYLCVAVIGFFLNSFLEHLTGL